MNPLTLVLFLGGYTVIYAAVKNEAPWDEWVAAFGGQKQGFAAALTSAVTKAKANFSTAGTVAGGKLETWGSATLAPDAMAAYRRASASYGGPIPLTGSYRSYVYQAALYATNHDRYAPPGSSYHVKGEAIDVSSFAIAKARDPLHKAGWCSPRADEPWHFSFGGCG